MLCPTNFGSFVPKGRHCTPPWEKGISVSLSQSCPRNMPTFPEIKGSDSVFGGRSQMPSALAKALKLIGQRHETSP
jgi:hypothetical protein